MNQILRVSPADLDCTVQAGVTRLQLDRHLRPHGLFFPVDPGADATLGGMVSTRASGSTAVRYGTMSDNMLALTVVIPGGEVIHTGTRARKSSAGYDLTHLFIGTEGTLGVITDVTLRLQSVPEAVSTAVVGFEKFDAAVKAVTQIRQAGVNVARIEFSDERTVKAINRFSGLSLAEQPTLFLEFHGTTAIVRECAEVAREITRMWGRERFPVGCASGRHVTMPISPACIAAGLALVSTNLAAIRVHHRNYARFERIVPAWPDRRTRWRWQFPCAPAR